MTRRRWLGGVILAAGCAALGSFLYQALLGTRPGFALGGVRYELLNPELLSATAALPLLLWGMGGSLTDLPRYQRWLSLLLRVALLSMLALGVARLSQVEDATRVGVVALVDVSDSITDAGLEEASEFVQAVDARRGEGDLKLVTFAQGARHVVRPEDSGTLPPIARHPPAEEGRSTTEATNPAAALRLAHGLFPPGHLKRVVLIGDGGQTHGDLVSEAARAREFGVTIYHHRLTAPRPREVAIAGLDLPGQIQVGESFSLRATVFATHPTSARLRLYQGPVLNGLDPVRDVELAAGETEVAFRSVVRRAGEVTYRVELAPEGGDRFELNNRMAATAIVPGRPAVLVVESQPSRARYLAEALHAAEYAVDVRAASALPRSLGEIRPYDFVILSDVPADAVSLQQMDILERYVRDVGGGFMMAGGENSFGLGGYQGTRMERLLPVRMDSERRRDEHSLALALVIDQSGSMSGQKIELAKEAAKATAELLGPDDLLAVIGFSSEPERKVRLQSARNRVRIGRHIARLAAQGGTAIFPALDMAFQDLLSVRAQTRHVILLTDGQTQEAGIEDLVQAMRSEAITVSTVGLGTDVNRGLLQSAANLGGGRSYFTNDPHNVPRIFVRETTTVGRNSAVEELVRAVAVEPADFLKGIDLRRAPYLRGYVATQPKPRPAQVIIQSELGEPLLARWRVGLGWSLAWTSDVKARWAVEWLRWRGFVPFWGQLVREHMRERRGEVLPMQARVVDDQLRVVVDAVGEDDRFVNGLQSKLTVEGPLGVGPDAGGGSLREQRLRQVAPGRYETRLPIEGYGSFVLKAEHRREGRMVGRSHLQISRPYPREYAGRSEEAGLLAAASALTGGGPAPDPAVLYDPGLERVRAHRDLWPILVMLALALFLVDLLVRRVRLGRPAPQSA